MLRTGMVSLKFFESANSVSEIYGNRFIMHCMVFALILNATELLNNFLSARKYAIKSFFVVK
jgi:hypothetical protein